MTGSGPVEGMAEVGVLDSQALETVIGLVLLLAVVSLAASTIVEGISALINKRGNELKAALDRLLGTPAAGAGADLANTTVITSLAPDERRFPSYLSATAFVDAVSELIQKGTFPPRIKDRLLIAAREGATNIASLRSELQRVFDEAMQRVTGLYKRWTMAWLFGIGLAIAVVGNISVFHAAESLWRDTATREAVAGAAENVGEEGIEASELDSIAATLEQLDELGLPVGWTDEAKADWGASITLSRVGIVLGWLATAALTMLGAPFWFDLLERLVKLRSSGTKPGAPSTTPVPFAPQRQLPDGRDTKDLDDAALTTFLEHQFGARE